jgi:hypothetical protein
LVNPSSGLLTISAADGKTAAHASVREASVRILHLTLKRKWFDLIASGQKKYEYRQDKPYWQTRLVKDDGFGKEFDIVRFKNGYSKNAPLMDVEFKGISFTTDKWWNPKHGEEFTGNIIVIRLGEVLRTSNYRLNTDASAG